MKSDTSGTWPFGLNSASYPAEYVRINLDGHEEGISESVPPLDLLRFIEGWAGLEPQHADARRFIDLMKDNDQLYLYKEMDLVETFVSDLENAIGFTIDYGTNIDKEVVLKWACPIKSLAGFTSLSQLRFRLQRLIEQSPDGRLSQSVCLIALLQESQHVSDNRFLLEQLDTPALGWRGWHIQPGRKSRYKYNSGGVLVPVQVIRLGSMSAKFFMEEQPEVLRAYCTKGGKKPPETELEKAAFEAEHDAPDENCHCGLYAVHHLDYLHQHWGMHAWPCEDCVIGLVLGFGKVLFHGDGGDWGWRSEKQMILGFLDRHDDKGKYERHKMQRKGNLWHAPDMFGRLAAEQFKRPFLKKEALLMYAAEYGEWYESTPPPAPPEILKVDWEGFVNQP